MPPGVGYSQRNNVGGAGIQRLPTPGTPEWTQQFMGGTSTQGPRAYGYPPGWGPEGQRSAPLQQNPQNTPPKSEKDLFIGQNHMVGTPQPVGAGPTNPSASMGPNYAPSGVEPPVGQHSPGGDRGPGLANPFQNLIQRRQTQQPTPTQSTGGPAPRTGMPVVTRGGASFGGPPDLTNPFGFDYVPDLIQNELRRTAQAQQDAADRQRQVMLGEAERIRQTGQDGSAAVYAGAERGAGILGDYADDLQGLGDRYFQDFTAYQDANADYQRGLAGNPQPYMDEAQRLTQDSIQSAQRAEQQFSDAIGEFEDLSAQNMSAVASGIRESANNALQMATSPINPDGTPKTPQQQMAEIYQVQQTVNDQVTRAITPLSNDFNQNLVGLRQNLSGLINTVAQFEQAGAGVNAQLAGIQAGIDQAQYTMDAQREANRNQAFANQRALYEAGAQLGAMQADLIAQAPLTATQLEMQGEMAAAQIVQNNPETVVSLFEGLMNLLSTNEGLRLSNPTRFSTEMSEPRYSAGGSVHPGVNSSGARTLSVTADNSPLYRESGPVGFGGFGFS